jgi:lysosomal alpha-mannosidase
MLGGNQFKKDLNRLVWNVASTSNRNEDGQQIMDERAIPAVQLKPMEIRTFI